MESPSAWARLGEGGKNGSQASRSGTAIEDRFSAGDKSRPALLTRNAYRTIRGGRVARGVLRSRDFEDGNVAETSIIQDQCGLPKADQIPRRRDPAGPSAAARRVARTCDGGAGFHQPSWSGRPVRDITGFARGRRQRGPSSYSLDREFLPDAERNLRVRLSETRP
jgi:hypothetical protein